MYYPRYSYPYYRAPSIIYCVNCGTPNWRGNQKCRKCGKNPRKLEKPRKKPVEVGENEKGEKEVDLI